VATDPHALWANWLRGTVTLPAGIGDVRQYQDRVKRLEEAGEKLNQHIYQHVPYSTRFEFCMDDQKEWTAAKEAKP
jgi:hypothetical protein